MILLFHIFLLMLKKLFYGFAAVWGNQMTLTFKGKTFKRTCCNLFFTPWKLYSLLVVFAHPLLKYSREKQQLSVALCGPLPMKLSSLPIMELNSIRFYFWNFSTFISEDPLLDSSFYIIKSLLIFFMKIYMYIHVYFWPLQITVERRTLKCLKTINISVCWFVWLVGNF